VVQVAAVTGLPEVLAHVDAKLCARMGVERGSEAARGERWRGFCFTVRRCPDSAEA
jgi:hypothetical protein